MPWYRYRRRRRKSTNTKHYRAHKEIARALIHERLEHYNAYYQLPYKRVAVRNQRRRWGSCSSLGNLNFNYKILFLPEEIRDYIIVHELCHLKELNHSPRFWALVAEMMPAYNEYRKMLRRFDRMTHAELTRKADSRTRPDHCLSDATTPMMQWSDAATRR